MKDQRNVALRLIGDVGLKALDNEGLVIVSRDERDNTIIHLESVSAENATLKTKDNKADLISKIASLLCVDENSILNKIKQMQNALKPIAAMPVGESVGKTSILVAKEAINDTTDIASPVIKERRTSVYVPPKTTISTNKRVVRVGRIVPNVVTKKDNSIKTRNLIGNIKSH